LQHKFGKIIEYNFFASYHGKGPCDGHAGVAKQKVRRFLRTGAIIEGIEDVVLLYTELKNTDPRVLDVDRTELLPDLDDVIGVRSYHCFRYKNNKLGVVYCYMLSTSPMITAVPQVCISLISIATI
jgi:hypothetical protein